MLEVLLASTIGLFVLTGICCTASIISDKPAFYHLSRVFFALAAVSSIWLGITRMRSVSFAGLHTLTSSIWGYFYILSVILLIIAVYLYFSKWNRQWKSFMALVSPFNAIILLISIPFIDSARKFATETNTALLPAHIALSVLGEVLFFFSFAGSVLYLIMEGNLKSKRFMNITERLPNLESIEKFNRWVISRSLLLLSLGIILGLTMVELSFHRLFLGTAKEAHILSSWVVIVFMFLIRKKAGISAHRISIINIMAFIFVMFLFIFTNIYISKGFHSFQ
ncbi:MAG TPA: cytochrome c biogenesis protein CcsA [Spirochaetota bacterium]|nr:cytochrome c biogenesis protein CcsA [Spirochaetota bacterium]HPI90515.1 cytochrome c biogenesis protein CcsA [Spirochaetota bacterium]HPR46947.1 cytochrome c biogenesis protein CcsA [Spirochaetota bacterium]